MKKLFVIFFIALMLQSCFGQDLKIELINKTGFDIDSAAICDLPIGLFKKDSTITVELNQILMQDHSIMGFPEGNIKGKKRHPLVWECGTGAKSITNGSYSFDIIMVEDKNGYQLYYRRKL